MAGWRKWRFHYYTLRWIGLDQDYLVDTEATTTTTTTTIFSFCSGEEKREEEVQRDERTEKEWKTSRGCEWALFGQNTMIPWVFGAGKWDQVWVWVWEWFRDSDTLARSLACLLYCTDGERR